MSINDLLPPETHIDLSNCDREPIHIPGAIQPHGMLLVLDPATLVISQVSTNAATFLNRPPDTLLGVPLDTIISADLVAYLRNALRHEQLEANPLYMFTLPIAGHAGLCDGIAHLSNGLIVLEFEPTQERPFPPSADPYRTVRIALGQLRQTLLLGEFCNELTNYVRQLTGFDRVMTYRFAPDGSGEVIAESIRDGLTPYLGLHYPASDIPQQARALYLRNWLRLIPDVDYVPTTIWPTLNPDTGRHLDMSYAVLRSVSPLHIEYLRNMGVRATMAISLIDDKQLWGMIVCHHYEPRYVPYDIRTACEFLGQVASSQLASKEDGSDDEYRARLRATQTHFVELMSGTAPIIDALTTFSPNLLDFIQAGGAALCVEGRCRSIGVTPDEEQIKQLVAWLARQEIDGVFASDALSRSYPPAAQFVATGSGVLAITLGKTQHDYVLWFRPETPRTVTWGGDPQKPVEISEDGMRISPRKSFEAWKQQVSGTSLPWRTCEIEAAHELRSTIVTMVLNRAEELARLNVELQQSNAELDAFAYIASHDLKEPLRGIHNYAGFLIEDYQDKLDEDGVNKLQTMIRLTQRMEALIESLLYYSRVGRVDLSIQLTDLNRALHKTLELLAPRLEETGTQVRIPRPLPTVRCDHARIGEVFHNLISNAIKYNTKDKRWVEIGYRIAPGADAEQLTNNRSAYIFYVQDNGIGIQQKHQESIFRIFKRLHARTAFGGGTGAGLTIARKIVERHGGRIWVESVYGEGSTFLFTLAPQAML